MSERIPPPEVHRHELPTRDETDALVHCSCGLWFYALPHDVWRGPNTHWAPVSWWNRRHKARIAALTDKTDQEGGR